MPNRLTTVEIEWTEEQKRLINQITKESTGLLIGVQTSKPSLPNEFGGVNASESDKRLVNILHETNAAVIDRLGGAPLADDPRFEGIIALAMNW
jgi:hypothetical protein